MYQLWSASSANHGKSSPFSCQPLFWETIHITLSLIADDTIRLDQLLKRQSVPKHYIHLDDCTVWTRSLEGRYCGQRPPSLETLGIIFCTCHLLIRQVRCNLAHIDKEKVQSNLFNQMVLNSLYFSESRKEI